MQTEEEEERMPCTPRCPGGRTACFQNETHVLAAAGGGGGGESDLRYAGDVGGRAVRASVAGVDYAGSDWASDALPCLEGGSTALPVVTTSHTLIAGSDSVHGRRTAKGRGTRRGSGMV